MDAVACTSTAGVLMATVGISGIIIFLMDLSQKKKLPGEKLNRAVKEKSHGNPPKIDP